MLLRQLSLALRRRFFLFIFGGWLVFLFFFLFFLSFKKQFYIEVYFSQVACGVLLCCVSSQKNLFGEKRKFPALFGSIALPTPLGATQNIALKRILVVVWKTRSFPHSGSFIRENQPGLSPLKYSNCFSSLRVLESIIVNQAHNLLFKVNTLSLYTCGFLDWPSQVVFPFYWLSSILYPAVQLFFFF